VAIASNMDARIAVVKRDCDVLASQFNITRIGCASIVIITRDWSVLATL
jgi:hypothetical protein